MSEPLFTVKCVEPEGEFERSVFLLELTKENLRKFWNGAKQFPTLYGKEIKSVDEFLNLFISYDEFGYMQAEGLFFYVPDEAGNILGVFYITNILYDNKGLIDAQVHYSFFDKRHRGRVPLVKRMLRWAFDELGFQRLSATVPLYSSRFTRQFILNVGFSMEGKKRKAAFYKDQWFDEMCYGIIRDEVISTTPVSEVSPNVDGEDENSGRGTS